MKGYLWGTSAESYPKNIYPIWRPWFQIQEENVTLGNITGPEMYIGGTSCKNMCNNSQVHRPMFILSNTESEARRHWLGYSEMQLTLLVLAMWKGSLRVQEPILQNSQKIKKLLNIHVSKKCGIYHKCIEKNMGKIPKNSIYFDTVQSIHMESQKLTYMLPFDADFTPDIK